MKPHKSFSIKECKIKASMLLKSLHSDDVDQAKKAAKRFQRLLRFAHLSVNDLQHANIKHKDALAVIASEKGFSSWTDLKCQLPFIRGGFLNHWFANYTEAKSFQKLNDGFLLPFQNQFFICDANYINNLGFNAEDTDWKLIGYDWAKPEKKEAWRRLYKKWVKIQGDKS